MITPRLLILLAVLVGTGSLLLSPVASGIHGRLIADLTPGVYPALFGPVRARIVVTNFARVRVATIETGNDGSFSTNLSPGVYYVAGESIDKSHPGDIYPITVTVRPLTFGEVDLNLHGLAQSER